MIHKVVLFLSIDGPTKQKKVNAITNTVHAEDLDLNVLRQLAISRGGLLNDQLRIKAYPKLLDVDIDNIPEKPSM